MHSVNTNRCFPRPPNIGGWVVFGVAVLPPADTPIEATAFGLIAEFFRDPAPADRGRYL